MMQWLLVFFGGGIGSLVRYFIGKSLVHSSSSFLPLATILANIISCFIMGIAIQKYLNQQVGDPIKWLIIIGFCGGMSTFSTFAFEIFEYIQKGQIAIGFTYIVLSIFLGIFMLILGMKAVSL